MIRVGVWSSDHVDLVKKGALHQRRLHRVCEGFLAAVFASPGHRRRDFSGTFYA